MKHKYTECLCNSADHTLRWTYSEVLKDGEDMLILECSVRHYESFFKRLKKAIKYIFRKGEMDYDTFIINKDEANKIKKLIKKIYD